MAVRQWHVGKIVMLWLAAGLLTAFFIWVVPYINSPSGLFELALIAAAVGFLVTAFVITWIWLGGREQQ